MMPEDEYDLAGFTVGVVDKEKILNNETMHAPIRQFRTVRG